MNHLAGFIALAFVVIATPGPDTVLTVRNTLRGGRRAGVATAFGVAAGQAVWALATSAGVAALLVASRPAFEAVRIVGAIVLIVLGVRALWSALRRERADADADAPSAAPRDVSIGAAWAQGLLSNLGNPKMAVFFPSLLPPFAAHGSFAELLALGTLFCGMTLTWLTVYAFVIARAGDWMRRSAVRRTLDAVAGAFLVGFGVKLATERR